MEANENADTNRCILSLFDYSGNWSKPYREAGYKVVQIDLLLGSDIFDIKCKADLEKYGKIHGVLAAPPCTHFSLSGAQYWKQKDADGRTEEGLKLIRHTLQIIEWAGPEWWVLENPVGRLPQLMPELGKPFFFQPWWYGDPYTKKTALFGEFNSDLPRNEVKPNRNYTQGTWIQKVSGTNKNRSVIRVITPLGFAYAFFKANP